MKNNKCHEISVHQLWNSATKILNNAPVKVLSEIIGVLARQFRLNKYAEQIFIGIISVNNNFQLSVLFFPSLSYSFLSRFRSTFLRQMTEMYKSTRLNIYHTIITKYFKAVFWAILSRLLNVK